MNEYRRIRSGLRMDQIRRHQRKILWVIWIVVIGPLMGISCLEVSVPSTNDSRQVPLTDKMESNSSDHLELIEETQSDRTTIVLMGTCELSLEFARTIDDRERGLMGRTIMEENHGMIFVFPEEAFLRFWMLGTWIPLDVVFLDGDGIVVDIQTMMPEIGVPEKDLTIYTSRMPALYGIEVNEGIVRKCDIKVGSEISVDW